MAVPRPSGRCERRGGVRAVALALATLLAVPLPAAANADLEGLLLLARRAAREKAAAAADPFESVGAAGGLWSARAHAARAVSARDRGDFGAMQRALAGLPETALGLPGLGEALKLSADAATARAPLAVADVVNRLAAFASGTALEPLRRAALETASRLARTGSERAAVAGALAAWEKTAPRTPRAVIAGALLKTRIGAGATATLVDLAASLPDAPERAPDLFDDGERRLFSAAVRGATPEIRIARARAIAHRAGDEAVLLVSGLPATPQNRLAAAEVKLVAGRTLDALKELRRPGPLSFDDPDTARHAQALELSARLRVAGAVPKAERRIVRRRGGRRVPARMGALIPSTPVAPAATDAAPALLAELDILAGTPLREADRRRLLGDAVRLCLRAGLFDEARRRLEPLLAIEPSASAGAEDLFREAFARYLAARRGDVVGGPGSNAGRDGFRAAAAMWEQQAATYRDVAIRRRATYWAARARERAGDLEGARTLWASLVPGTSSDLYGRWAATALGISTPAAVPAVSPAEPEVPLLTAVAAGAPSRELLACGLASIAEDAAETEGSLDASFSAVLASERGDHRRATSLLKSLYPELGSPEEGSVPLAVRRAYYPLAHPELLRSAAERNGVAPTLLFALVRQESLFQPAIRSSAGALGLMQVMPATGRFLARREGLGRVDLTDPGLNVRLGSSYLAQLLSTFDGDSAAALAAYNAGPGRVARWRREGASLAPDEFIESIPLAEPRDYVKKVLFFEGAYRSLYGDRLRPAAPAAATLPVPKLP